MVQGLSSAQGVPIVQSPCTVAGDQRWNFRQVGSNWQIVSNETGLCLMPNGGSATSGTGLVQGTCSTDSARVWSLRGNADGSFSVIGAASGLCVDLPAGASNGTPLRQSTCSSTSNANQNWRIETARTSLWDPIVSLPLIPVAAAMLPGGELLFWSAEERFAFATGVSGRTYTAVYNPVTKVSTERLVTETGHDMFCPGISMLPNGQILVSGGSDDSKTSIYDPVQRGWLTAAPMNVGRGYQSSTTLSDGSVFMVGGSWSGSSGGKIGERWTPSNAWVTLPDVVAETMSDTDPEGIYRSDNHMWLFAATGGWVFQAGPGRRMHWIDTRGRGATSFVGTRSDDGYAMNGSAVMYEPWKILTTGGAPAYVNGTATRNAYRIDISAGPGVAPTVRKLPSMAYTRGFHNSVVLPNGQVVVVGGQAVPVPFSDEQSVLVPELWDPQTEQFLRMAPMRTPRNYHSFALLQPEGRVMVAGGGLCGPCPENHPNAAVPTPPYLLKSDGSPAARPGIVDAPATAAAGANITVTTDGPVDNFVLVRYGTATHTVNTDQRRIPLAIRNQTPGGNPAYSLALPADTGLLLPGYYMLFALDAKGVPSMSRTVRIN